MGDGQHPNFLRVNEEGDVIRENPEVDPTVAVGTNPGQFWVAGNPVGGRSHFFFETNPQTRFNAFIAGDGIGKFSRSFIKDPEIHAG